MILSKIKSTQLVLLGFILLASCNSKTKLKEVRVSEQYSLEVPEFTEETKTLNDDASLQYFNGVKEFYVIVLDEEKDVTFDAIKDNMLEFKYGLNLKGYASLISDSFDMNTDVQKKSELKDTTINGLSAQIQEMHTISEKVETYFHVAFIEGKKHFYQVLVWTLYSKKKEHNTLMKQVINSFKELPGKEVPVKKKVS